MTRILDCTLRDGGYYTDWDFDSSVVCSYIEAMNRLPVDYLEVGYRNIPSKEYLGKFGYSPAFVLRQLREQCNKKVVVMLNEKSTRPKDLYALLRPIVGLVDMIRLAIDPANFDRAVVLAKEVKEYGFEVAFNCMYMSKWNSHYPGFIKKLTVLDDFCDLFCMVDSYGGVTPADVSLTYAEIKKHTKVPVGFHGHNNLQLGLINTVTAMQIGADFVDATVLGMGRGAGNLNLELLFTYLNAHNGLNVDFNVLGDVVATFTPLMEKYRWGTNLPYMIAGANKIPQKEVMEWVTNRIYSFNSIIRALENRKENKIDNAKYPVIDTTRKYDRVVIIGGGDSVKRHIEGIKAFIRLAPNTALVFATARHANLFKDVKAPKAYILVGTESRRLAASVDHNTFRDIAVLPPYPRTMGTEVPDFAKASTFELETIDFIGDYHDSCTTIALQCALNFGGEIFSIGYDGYPGSILSEKEVTLTHENKTIFEAFQEKTKHKLKSLTPSLYKELEVSSIYQYI